MPQKKGFPLRRPEREGLLSVEKVGDYDANGGRLMMVGVMNTSRSSPDLLWSLFEKR